MKKGEVGPMVVVLGVVGFAHILFERRKVRVEGDAAEVVDEGEVLGDVRRGPAAEEPVQNPLVSPCRGTATNGSNPPLKEAYHQTATRCTKEQSTQCHFVNRKKCIE